MKQMYHLYEFKAKYFDICTRSSAYKGKIIENCTTKISPVNKTFGNSSFQNL